METATTAGAGIAVTAPLWLQTLNPYLQLVAVVMGCSWIAVQMYYKIKNERRKGRT
jgi:hypothetical protein